MSLFGYTSRESGGFLSLNIVVHMKYYAEDCQELCISQSKLEICIFFPMAKKFRSILIDYIYLLFILFMRVCKTTRDKETHKGNKGNTDKTQW